MTLLELGDIAGAERWLGLAGAAASNGSSRDQARQLEMWRGIVRAGAGDAESAISHLKRAVAIANEGGRASARCELFARLALVAAGLVAGRPGERPDGTEAIRRTLLSRTSSLVQRPK